MKPLPCFCGGKGDHFCEPRADRAQHFFERVLVHTKGRFARLPFILADWQRDDIIRPLFGEVRWDEQTSQYVRQYTLGWIELARKNGKSEILAGIALMLLCADDEESAEVYGAACDRDQAAVVYNVAKRMVELSPYLSKRLTVIDSKRRIIDPKTNSFYQVIAADAGGALGTNPSGVIFDEVLTQPNQELWDALKTGMGTRVRPLMVGATTAGYTSSGFAFEEHKYAERVQEDPALDPRRFVYLRNTPRDADWRDEANWFHANPALGDFLSVETLRTEAREADNVPTKQNAFRQFRLNQWVSQQTRWLDMATWDRNGGMVVAEDLAGRDCFGGLDLASTGDFTAWVLVFPNAEGGYEVLPRFWVPEAALERRSDMRVALQTWKASGFLTVTPGDVVSYDQIEADINRDATKYNVREIGYDPWNATQVIQHMEDGGLTCIAVPQTMARMTAPSKEVERLLGDGLLNHGGNPVLRWMADNVEAQMNNEGQMKPSKKKSAEKIDGVMALVNALAVAIRPREVVAESTYLDLGSYL